MMPRAIPADLRCRVCESSRLRSVPFGYAYNTKWLAGVECRDCGVIFLHPQPMQEELKHMYSKEYFEGDFRCGHAGSYFDSGTLDALADQRLLDRIKKIKPAGNFLEIGCAGGAFLRAARDTGYTVQGVEFSEDAVRFARERFQLDVREGDVTDAGFETGRFDVVFMGDVLEHLPDPAAVVREAYRIMQPGGVLVIECPMQTNTLFSRMGFGVYRVLGATATVHLPPYHLFEYRPGSLRSLLERFGFGIMRISQGIIPPREIALRGSKLQNMAKKILQYPNYALTAGLGVFGDRVEVFAAKKSK
jgi:SAM-dependent methyltransferase